MIGILTPYIRGDVTAAALRLADLAVGFGHDVRVIACEQQTSNVHPFWDKHIKPSKGDGVYLASQKCDKLIYFMTAPGYLEMTKLVAESARHIIVPPWHQLRFQDKKGYSSYDLVVLNGAQYAAQFTSEISSKNVSQTLWDAGIPFVQRDGLVISRRLVVAIYCDNRVIDFCGPLVIDLCAELLRAMPKLHIHILSTKSWGRKDRGGLKQVSLANPERLHLSGLGNLHEQVTVLHNYDWLIYPAVRDDFGTVCTRALSCGVPVIAHDIYPFNAYIVHDLNGLLVPCEVKHTLVRAPLAVPCFANWLDVCTRAFTSSRELFKLQKNDWNMDELRDCFTSFWRKVLDN